MFQKLELKSLKELESLKNNEEWENFTIAFYGETGAGKSTLIECLRMFFKEQSKVVQQERFKRLYSNYQENYQNDERKKQAILNELHSLQDGAIIGDGRSDFTLKTRSYSWGIEEVKARSEYLADQFCQVGLFKDLPKEYRAREINKTLDDDLTNHNLQSVKLPNQQRQIVRNAKELARAVIDYLLENAREAFESYTDEESQRYICWDKAKAQLRDRDGTLVVPFEKYGFYFVSNASYQTVGSNLKDLILGCELNPKDFIV